MKSLRKKLHITDLSADFKEINLGYTPADSNNNAYYKLGRGELKEKVIESGVFSEDNIINIEKEGCRQVIGNSLCFSPFSGYRNIVSILKAQEIIKGLKIIMAAVAADTGEMLLPDAPETIHDAYRSFIEKSPNIYARKYKDHYPAGMDRVLHERLGYYTIKEDYYPGKEGCLLVSVEDLFRIYIEVEEPENTGYMPVFLSVNAENYLVWIDSEHMIGDLLTAVKYKKNDGIIIAGDLLNGRVIIDEEQTKIGNYRQIFIVDDIDLNFNNCILCGLCRNICPAYINEPHSMKVLNNNGGLLPYKNIYGCLSCGLCGFFCPGWK